MKFVIGILAILLLALSINANIYAEKEEFSYEFGGKDWEYAAC